MPKNYLDLHGLTLYDGEIKEYIDDEANEIIEITSAEYDQLSYAEKHNGKYYHITDRTSSASLDVNVTQTESSANSDLEVLLSNSASTATEVNGVKKSAGLKFNPSTGDLTVSDINTPSGETWDGTHTSLKDAIVSGGGGGSSTLAGLTDVTLTSPTDGQVLTYDSTNNKWVNADGSTASELSEMTLSDYNRLTTAQKNDGTARFIPKSDIGNTSDLDCTAITGYYENNNVMNVTSTSTKIDITWSGDVYIGCNFRFNQGIDVTDWDKIVFDVNTSSCYGGGETAGKPDWYLQMGLLVYPITAAINLNPTSTNWVALAYFPRSNTDYGTVEIDVSNLTGTYYLTCVCHGWNATIENVKLATLGGYSSQIKYMSETYGEQVDFTGATASANGASGLVPRPVIADKDKFLKGDGTWSVTPDTTYSDFTGATSQTAGGHGLVPAPTTSDVDKYLKGDGTWAAVSGGGGTDTWRNVKINGTQQLSTDTSSGAIDFVNGSNTTVTFNSTGNTISITADDEIIEMTSAAYDQLSSAEKNNGKYYHITDRNSGLDVDANVTQTASSSNANYEVIFSGTADNTTRTEAVRKANNFTFNPSTGKVSATMVGVSGTPTANTDVATKQYVDNLIDTAITQVLADTY